MYKGVWTPLANHGIKSNILILGESHYSDNNSQGTIGSYRTDDVINEYFRLLKTSTHADWVRFFTTIANSFGYNTSKEIIDFYEQIYFGNYIEVLCDTGNENMANSFITDNSTTYNYNLLNYCNENRIDVIICFSIRVYNALPPRLTNDKNSIVGKIGERNNIVRKNIYKANHQYKTSDENMPILDKDILVYGIRHPSSKSGYNVSQIYNYLIKENEVSWLCK